MNNKNNSSIFALIDKTLKNKCVEPQLDEAFCNIEKKRDLNAFTAIFKEEAYERAVQLNKKMASGAKLGRLFGVPVSIKDNIALEGKTFTCTSNMLRGYVAHKNADVVNRLLSEDAIIVGKTNMDEFAMGGSNNNSSYGRAKNPINPDCVTGGSSGGSAASVSSSQCLASLGTDTGGSVRQPAAFCGIVGSKPTYGTICGDGVMPMAPSFDQVGALTNNVEDNALINSVISRTGYGKTSSQIIWDIKSSNDKQTALSLLKGKKIAISKDFEQDIKDSPSAKCFDQAIKLLQKAGAEIINFSIPELLTVLEIYKIMMSVEGTICLSVLDGQSFGIMPNKDEITRTLNFENLEKLAKGEQLSAHQLATIARTIGFGQEVKKRIFKGTFFLQNKQFYFAAAKTLKTICAKLNTLYQDIDAIIWPTAIIGAFTLEQEKPLSAPIDLSDKLTIVANLSGRPSITVPCGCTNEGLPLGLHFMGKHDMDDQLFTLAGIYEYLFTSKNC